MTSNGKPLRTVLATLSVLFFAAGVVATSACKGDARGSQSSSSSSSTRRPRSRGWDGPSAPGGGDAALPMLTEYDRCIIRALRDRRTPEDDCLADCFESGRGQRIGGGCYHVCFAHKSGRNIATWRDPEGWQACDSTVNPVPGP